MYKSSRHVEKGPSDVRRRLHRGPIILAMVGLDRFGNALGTGVSVVFAMRANIDYYKFMVLGDDGWW